MRKPRRSFALKIEPQLLKQALSALDQPPFQGKPFQDRPFQDRLRFIVYLREQADLGSAAREPDRMTRRRGVVQACQRVNQAQIELPSGHRLRMVELVSGAQVQRVPIVVGIKNEEWAEVLSGLEEEQTIRLP